MRLILNMAIPIWKSGPQEKSLKRKAMKTNKEKAFDAVKMMREIRNKHHEAYKPDPQLREEKLKEIRKKYADKVKQQKTAGS